jgi:hypothetical protein
MLLEIYSEAAKLRMMRWIMTDKTKGILITILISVWIIYTVISIPTIIFMWNEQKNIKYVRASNRMLTEINDKFRDKQATITSELTPIPQWFVDEFNQTFLGSYSINIAGTDKLNLVIITSNKSFYDLRKIVGFDGCLQSDMMMDIIKWEYICPDDKIPVVTND